MDDNQWSENFKKKLQEKDRASQEAKKSFQVYKDALMQLFDHIESKVKSVAEISIVRTVVGSSSPTPGPIKALTLKCGDKFLKFVPEGINPDQSRGRIRIEHNNKSLSKFIYLHLIIDPKSTAIFPDNLIWVFNANGEDVADFTQLPQFEEKHLEQLMENCFLEC